MKISEAFPSKWLKASDLGGRKVNVTIDSLGYEDIGGDGDKLVVYFAGKKKGLVLNVTNANMIVEVCKSEETDEWIGKTIALFATKVDFQGRRVDAIRVDYPQHAEVFGVNNRQPAPPPPPAREPGDDDAPF